MNLVFVNHMHPSTQHVSGMRSWFFARELAKRGHRVVQICEWRVGSEPAAPPESIAQQLQTHDWASPLLLAVQSRPRLLLERIRSPNTPAKLRKALVTYNYLRHSGMFTDFSGAALPYLRILAQVFRPDVTWGLFGNTDCWLLAQRLARLSDCPWVADMKDSWEVFLRRPLRGVIARRFQDMAACTANADFNAEVLRRWFPQKSTVIYSGVDTCFFEATPASSNDGDLRLTLTGSVHEVGVLEHFVDGLRAWLEQGVIPPQSDARRLEIVYAGADSKRVSDALGALKDIALVQINGYLPLPELAALCRSANANVYIWNPKGFHHKLLELLSCGRPVIAFPAETDESRRLAVAIGGQLLVPNSVQDLIVALNRVAIRAPYQPTAVDAMRDCFTWAAQARGLEAIFMEAGGLAKS